MTERPRGVVILVHGSGITRHDRLNRFVAASLVRAGFAALLVDLLEDCEAHERYHVFDVETQAERLIAVKDWLRTQPATRSLDIGYFGTGVGAGVVLMAAAKAPQGVGALVARGGRPDIALDSLHRVEAPTLFIASESGTDRDWVEAAYRTTGAWKDLVHIAGAGDSFREPRANEAVAQYACRWFSRHLAPPLEPSIRELETDLKQRHPGADCQITNREHDDDPGVALRDAFNAASAQLEALDVSHRV